MNHRAKKFCFAAAIILLPVCLLWMLAEVALRVMGFGYATAPLLKNTDGPQAVWVGNPDFTRLFFPAALKRLPPHNRVPVDKAPHTLRYMVVGGSAAAGDPDVDFSIARHLQWILSTAYPERNWEVLNLAFTACNSHVAAEVVRQSAPYALDGIVVMLGNNEVIGPFGPGTSLTDRLPAAWQRSLLLQLRKSKSGQYAQQLREALTPNATAPSAWRGMQHFLEFRFPADAPQLADVYANFTANLEAMEAVARRHRIPIALCDVPVNLLDQPPFFDDTPALPAPLQSAILAYLQSGQSPLAIDSMRDAATAHPQSAMLAYVLGRRLFEAGERAQAAVFLSRARDLDQLRFRADSALNARIRAQWQRPNTHWLPVDASAALVADSPHQTLGFPHFYEHVHFSVRANFLIARAIARSLLQHQNLPTAPLDTLQWNDAATALAYTPYEAWRVLNEIEQRFAAPPFNAIPGYPRLTAWMDSLRDALHTRIAAAEEKQAMTRTYTDAIAARPHDDPIQLNFAHFLIAFGRPEAAAPILDSLFTRNPTDNEIALTRFNLAITLNQPAAARTALQRIEAIFPQHPNLPTMQRALHSLDAP